MNSETCATFAVREVGEGGMSWYWGATVCMVRCCGSGACEEGVLMWGRGDNLMSWDDVAAATR